MKKKMAVVAVTMALCAAGGLANAGVVDQFAMTSAEYGMVSQYSAGGSINAQVYVEGAGANQVSNLAVYTRDASGFKAWRGVIPNSAVDMTGASTISVNVDTCAVAASAGCGAVNLSFTKIPSSAGWVSNGVSQQSWDGMLFQTAGIVSVQPAQVTGSVNGVAVTAEGQAFMGKYTNVSVTVSTGN